MSYAVCQSREWIRRKVTYTWKVLTSNPWVLQTVKGSEYPLSLYPQYTQPTEPVFPPEQAAQVREERQSLLEKGAVVPLIDSHESFYSSLFSMPKKNGQMKPLINLNQLNKWVATENLKIEGIFILRDLLKSGNWFVERCLFHSSHSNRPPEYQYLRFMLDGESYQLVCLYLACHVPRTFIKILKPVITFLRWWESNRLHKWHANSGKDFSTNSPTPCDSVVDAGFYYEPEVHIHTSQQIKILGLKTNFKVNRAQPSG